MRALGHTGMQQAYLCLCLCVRRSPQALTDNTMGSNCLAHDTSKSVMFTAVRGFKHTAAYTWCTRVHSQAGSSPCIYMKGGIIPRKLIYKYVKVVKMCNACAGILNQSMAIECRCGCCCMCSVYEGACQLVCMLVNV